jgi:hypothetical protein
MIPVNDTDGLTAPAIPVDLPAGSVNKHPRYLYLTAYTGPASPGRIHKLPRERADYLKLLIHMSEYLFSPYGAEMELDCSAASPRTEALKMKSRLTARKRKTTQGRWGNWLLPDVHDTQYESTAAESLFHQKHFP